MQQTSYPAVAAAINDVSKRNTANEDADAPSAVVISTKRVPWRIWTVLLISSFGIFLASVSTSALIIAFPILLQDLQMDISMMMWVLLIVMLMLGAIVPIAGKLGDMFGQGRVYKTGYVLFVIGSFGAGFVNHNNQGRDLLAARIVIGIGAALLFTNSSAILANSFAPYNKVGLSQGILQLSSALGTVLGPLVGGGFSETDWRWIFWFNVPIGGLMVILAFFTIKDPPRSPTERTFGQKMMQFDYIGAFMCSGGLVLILIAMVQGVVADPVLSQQGAIVGLVVAGCFCGVVFIADQFFAIDPLIPPSIFKNRIYPITVLCSTFMAFARNSITYNMIFFLQGPFGQDPLQAGINLIPYGIGIMVAGLISGAIADKLGIRTMIVLGPLITLAGAACLSVMNTDTRMPYVSGILLLCGFGVGVFQSPNSTASMLSVPPCRRGVAAAVNMLTSTFCMMLGIVLTFSLVLHALSAEELFQLFIYGGRSGNTAGCLAALATDYYVVIAACACASLAGLFLPADLRDRLRRSGATHRLEQASLHGLAPGAAGGPTPTGEKEEEAERVRALADALRAALSTSATLIIPSFAQRYAAEAAEGLEAPGGAGAPGVPLTDLAEPPSEWLTSGDLRRSVEGDPARDAVRLLTALQLLRNEGVVSDRFDPVTGLRMWTLAPRRPGPPGPYEPAAGYGDVDGAGVMRSCSAESAVTVAAPPHGGHAVLSHLYKPEFEV